VINSFTCSSETDSPASIPVEYRKIPKVANVAAIVLRKRFPNVARITCILLCSISIDQMTIVTRSLSPPYSISQIVKYPSLDTIIPRREVKRAGWDDAFLLSIITHMR
jgi:hypothetical protein